MYLSLAKLKNILQKQFFVLSARELLEYSAKTTLHSVKNSILKACLLLIGNFFGVL